LLPLILRSIAKRCVSKDEAEVEASWFETRSDAALLTMRGKSRVGNRPVTPADK